LRRTDITNRAGWLNLVLFSVVSRFTTAPDEPHLSAVEPVEGSDIRTVEHERLELRSCHKRQKRQAPTPQAPIRNRQTRKVANAKGPNRNTNLT